MQLKFHIHVQTAHSLLPPLCWVKRMYLVQLQNNGETMNQIKSFQYDHINCTLCTFLLQLSRIMHFIYFCIWHNRPPPQWVIASSFTKFLDHTQRRTAFGRTPLDGWSARRRDLYLTTHTTITTDRHRCSPAGFEPTISAGERPQTYVLDNAATGTGVVFYTNVQIYYH